MDVLRVSAFTLFGRPLGAPERSDGCADQSPRAGSDLDAYSGALIANEDALMAHPLPNAFTAFTHLTELPVVLMHARLPPILNAAHQAGFMISFALFGMMVGAILLGTIADRIGRRPAIAICVALFSVFTAGSGLVDDPYAFSVMRFFAGLGIGGVMANVVAQMTEFSHKRIRATMVTLIFSGYAVGGMLTPDSSIRSTHARPVSASHLGSAAWAPSWRQS